MAGTEPVMSLYDAPMWESIRAEAMALQRCRHCGAFRYPPAPACAECLAMDYDWRALSGTGTILSWVIFHRRYLDGFDPPYNVVAIRLAEGPIIISNLIGPEPAGGWIGREIELCFEADRTGKIVPRVRLKSSVPTRAAS